MSLSERLPIDTILMLVLGTVYVVSGTEALGALLALPVASYVFIDALVLPKVPDTALGRRFHLKLGLAMLTIFLAVVLPTISWMLIRQATVPWGHVDDGAIQTEESIKLLLEGKNPYTEDYLDTPLAEWGRPIEGMKESPTLYHNAYLPFIFLFSTPFYMAVRQLTGWYDQRLVYLLLLLCTLWPLMQHSAKPSNKLGLLIVFGLNFLSAPYLIRGGNDSFVWFWLITSTYLLQKGKITLSALSLGLACASKQTAWLFVPFFLAYLWIEAPSGSRWVILRKAYPLVVVPLLTIIPFIIWDASGFVEDTYSYLSGQAAASFPIRGFGFGGLLMALGFMRDRTAYFPFIVFQAAFCIPLLVFLLRRQLSDNTVKRCWLGYGLLFLTFAFFSRFINDSYLGITVNALALGFLSDAGQKARWL
jgi:hypothetical protein